MVRHTEAFLEKQRLRKIQREEERKRKEQEGFNSPLREARRVKNDEFYTLESDIEKELSHYPGKFKGKSVLCNCNDTVHTGFKDYFMKNFDNLGLSMLVCTGYMTDGVHGEVFTYDGKEEKVRSLSGDGSFDSEECARLLDECDVVVTNPPFSLFRKFISMLMSSGKEFIVIGNLNAVTYMEVFPYMKDDKVWMGATCFNGGTAMFGAPKDSFNPEKMSKKCYGKTGEDGSFLWRVSGVRWFTNMEHDRRGTEITLDGAYSPSDYPKYDNYDAINVGRVSEIPCDYDGAMGVPISFMDKYSPSQFRILGLMCGTRGEGFVNGDDGRSKFFMGGKSVYARVIIRRRQQ